MSQVDIDKYNEILRRIKEQELKELENENARALLEIFYEDSIKLGRCVDKLPFTRVESSN
jgi:hypothetical protein